MLRLICLLILSALLAACGSSKKQVNTPTPPLNNGIAKLVKYDILDPELADTIALKKMQQRIVSTNKLKDSPVGALTDDGNLVSGYALSKLMGAGFSLSDFLSPSNILLSGFNNKHVSKKFMSNVVFIEIADECDETCAYERIQKIALDFKQRHYASLGLDFPKNKNIQTWEWGGKYKNFSSYVTNDNGDKIYLVNMQEPEIFSLEGKRYFGSNPSKFGNNSRFYMGEFAETEDFAINALVETSKMYPELFVYSPKQRFKKSTNYTNIHYPGCRGNYIIEQGQVEMLYQMFGCYVYASNDNIPKDLNLIIYN